MFDIFALVVLIFAVTICARGGFVKGVLGLVSTALSVIFAVRFSAPLAEFIFDRFLREPIVSTIYTQITEQAQASPGGLMALLLTGIIFAAATLDPAASPEALPALESVIDAAVSPPITMVLRVLLGLVLFIIFWLVSRWVVSFFRAVNRIPLIGPVNSALGGLLGVGWAALILWLLAMLGAFYITITGGSNQFINADSLGGGYLFSYFFRMVG